MGEGAAEGVRVGDHRQNGGGGSREQPEKDESRPL